MIDEQKLEDLIVRAIKRGIAEGLASLPFTLPADPGAGAEPTKRTRKPKEAPVVATNTFPEPAAAPALETAVPEAPVAQNLPPVTKPSTVVADAQAEVANRASDPLPEIERKHVSASLITVAQSEAHGPNVAYKILTDLGVKDVNGLKTPQYVEVVAKAASLLGITVAEALKLEPKKV